LQDYVHKEDSSAFTPIQSISRHSKLWMKHTVNNRMRIPFVVSRSVCKNDYEHRSGTYGI